MNEANLSVFASGVGSNLLAIHNASKDKCFPGKLKLVICNKICPAFELAKSLNYETKLISNSNMEKFEVIVHQELIKKKIDLICLAGFMRILSPKFVSKWKNKILNIHPSILPSFPGLNTHKKVLSNGLKIHGSTVHIVDKGIDTGTIIAQSAITINNLDDEKVIEEKIKKTEHYLYSRAIRNYILHFYFKKNKNSLKSLKNKYSRVLYSI